jgi:hypothetical protein
LRRYGLFPRYPTHQPVLSFPPFHHLCAGLKVIRKKLVRKAIDMIKKLADGQDRALKELEEKDAAKGG